jgi:hypothetical protein
MRIPRVRFTTGGLMVAVAIAALAIGMVARSRRLGEVATRHRARSFEESQLMPRPGGGMVELLTKRGEWHRTMADKYERAARRPWLPIPPDPTQPE